MGYDSIRESPLMIVMKLHRWLMDDTRTTGKMIVGISIPFFHLYPDQRTYSILAAQVEEKPVDYRTSKRQKKVNVRFTLCTGIICSTYLISMCTHRIDVVISMVQRHRKFYLWCGSKTRSTYLENSTCFTFWHLCGNVFKDRHFYHCPDRNFITCHRILDVSEKKKITIARYRKFHRFNNHFYVNLCNLPVFSVWNNGWIINPFRIDQDTGIYNNWYA